MARVVCQVLAQSDRLTLIWSEGPRTFAPYSLENTAFAEFHRLTDQANQQLAHLVAVANDSAAAAQASFALAQTGHALYRLLFQLDHAAAAIGPEVRAWLEGLTRTDAVDRLEIIGDCFTVPWLAVYDQPPDQAAFSGPAADAACLKNFWGRRFALLGGRRVQWLRGRQLPEKPAVVLALDPVLRAGLPPDEQKHLADFQAAHDVVLADSQSQLAGIFQTQDVDVLYVCGPADGSAVRLGDERLTAESLAAIVFGDANDEEAPSGQTLLVLNATASGVPAGNLLAAFERFSAVGLIGSVQPLPAAAANCCGLDLLGLIITGQTVAATLVNLRQRYPQAGSLFFASCPGEVRTGPDDDMPPGLEPLPLPDEPFQPLAYLDDVTAPLLVAREFDTAQLAGLVDENTVRLVLVHGAPGVGRASLLHAGLQPYLEWQSVGYRLLRERTDDQPVEDERDYPVMSIRASGDLTGQVALALLDFCGRPYTYATPTGQTVTVDLATTLCATVRSGASEGLPEPDELRVALREDAKLLGRVLTALTAQLPFELVVLIEQGEELFSLTDSHRSSPDLRPALAMLHAALANTGRAKIIIALRTAYLGRMLDSLLQTPEDARAIRVFQVRELDEDELVEVLLLPTSKDPLPGTDDAPYGKYRFQFEQGLAEQIAREAPRQARANQTSAVALIQVVGCMLYERLREREERVARAADLKAIGGTENALTNYLAGLVKKTSSSTERKALKELLQKLFVRQADGSVTRGLVYQEDFDAEWARASNVKELVAAGSNEGIRLLDVHYLNVGGKEGPFVSLSHDALAPLAAKLETDAARRSYGWSKFFDALWITVPIAILMGAVALLAWRNVNAARDELLEQREAGKEIIDQAKAVNETNSAMHWPAYLGQVHVADKAVLAGDFPRARQALMSLTPSKNEPDVRGFDWYYLWHQMHLDQTTLLNNGRAVNAVALAGDGLTVAATSDDGAVRLWDTATGRQLRTLELKRDAKTAAGRAVTFSPDGKTLAAAGDDGAVRLWHLSRAGADHPLSAAALAAALPQLQAAGVFPYGTYASGLAEEMYKEQPLLTDHKEAVLALSFTPDGKKLAAASKEGVILVWDLTEKTPKVVATLKEHTKAVRALAYSPDGKFLASAGDDHKVCVWNNGKDSKATVLNGHPAAVTSVAWSPDSKTLASGGAHSVSMLDTGLVKLWDAPKWQERKRAPAFALPPVVALAFADKGKTLIAAGTSNALQFLDVQSGKEQASLRGHLSAVTALAVARDGAVVASGGLDGTAKIWLPNLLKTRDSFKASETPVCAVVFSQDDHWLATGTGDGQVKLWHTTTAEHARTMEGTHTGAVLTLVWSPNGKWLISGGADGHLKLWDTDPKSEKFGTVLDSVGDAHAKAVTCLTWGVKDFSDNHFLPHENMFFSGSLDRSVKQWTVDNGKLRKGKEVTNLDSGVLCLLHLPEAKKVIASGHEDGKVRLLDYDAGKLSAGFKHNVLVGHTAAVTGIAFKVYETSEKEPAPRFITASADQTVKYFNYGAGVPFMSTHGHGGPLTCMTLGPGPDDSLVTGSTDTTAKLWNPFGGQERWTFNPTGSAVRSVAVSHEAGWIVVAGYQDGTVRIYRSGKKGTTIE